MKEGAFEKKIETMEFELNIFREISKLSQAAFDIRRFLKGLMDLILRATRAEAGTLYLLDRSRENLVFEVVKGRGSKALIGKRLALGEGIAGWVTKTGQPYTATDVAKDPRWLRKFAEEIGFVTKNILCVPLRTAKEIIGAAEVINKKEGPAFGKSDLELLSSLANQIALVIENARLFLESARRIDQLKTLSSLSAILNSTLAQREVRIMAVEVAIKLMNSEAGSLLLLDEVTDELYFEVALGEGASGAKGLRLKLGEGIAGWVAQRGQPLLVLDCSKDSRWTPKVDKKSKFTTRNMICVPLKVKEKVIGALQVMNKLGDEPFTSEDLDIFASLADQVAIAIDNARLYEEIRETFLETAEALAEAIEKRDPYTGGHTKRVVEFSMAIAEVLKLPEEEKNRLKVAAILHDIGKIGVEDRILRKSEKLSTYEFEMIKQHPQVGEDIVKHIESLREIIPGILYHHERCDGTGYPEGLSGQDIPLIARIIAVADAFDAMASDRPYRRGLSDKLALEELKRSAGTQFDADVIEAFFEAYRVGKIPR